MFGSTAIIDRIALTWEQIEEYGPPPNPAKTTDARYEKYQEQYGDDSWELDALEPQVMADLIRAAVQARINQDYWQEALDRQQTGRDQLGQVSRRWEKVVDFLGNGRTMSEFVDFIHLDCKAGSPAAAAARWWMPTATENWKRQQPPSCYEDTQRDHRVNVQPGR